jgi:serine/threonine-protein kinase
MSPEQIMEEPVDHRADLFLFGLVLYTMIAGTHPFKKKSPLVTSAAILHEDPPPLSRFLALNHSSGLERVLLKMLEKEPSSRYQSVTEIAEDLLRIQQKLEKPSLWNSFLRFFLRNRSRAD